MSVPPAPEPSDQPDPTPPQGPDAGHQAGPARGPGRWLAGSLRWQSLIAAVATALIGGAVTVIVAMISRGPQPAPEPVPSPSATVRPGPVIDTWRTREASDPAHPPSGIAVTFVGTVRGLDPQSRVFAMVRRADEESDWPVAFADVDRRAGTWRAVVHVPRPRLPLEYRTGVLADVPPVAAVPSAGGTAAPEAAGALERLRREGPAATGIITLTPLRPVAPGTPAPTRPASGANPWGAGQRGRGAATGTRTPTA
ncbi:hypothetical protein K7B10_10770 [Streptomyces flavotricini]|uniref:Uncharacterized protein n=1 Tax=Streptomyces flavotricini TaxID=66888 RepID=A0ABS8E2T1_9ACTN|nr:hypothetical protein [Streptomyces flavotricini]MCC0095258.1 hypothetical protein [Streptomyces flavotricini]